MEATKIEQGRAALATLDLSAEVGRITEIQALTANIADAQQAAALRIREIAEELRDQRAGAEAVADALLGGDTATSAATAGPSAAMLEEERAALKMGIAELDRRNEEARRESEALRQTALAKVAKAAQPLADAIAADMIEAANRLAAGFAAARAVNEVTRGATDLLIAAKAAVAGLVGGDALLGHVEALDVPGEVAEALAPIAAHRGALRVPPVPRSARL